MTILTGQKIVFYAHVPKTGGTYVEDLFVANGYKKNFWCGAPKRSGLQVSFQHFERQRYEACLNFSVIEYAFITVRHPIDRLLSEYRNSGKNMDIEQWVRNIRNALVRNPDYLDNHFRPQLDFFRPPMQIFKQETNFSEQWARSLSENHNLGFTKFSTVVQRDTSKNERPLTLREAHAVVKFCQEYYRKDFDYFDYKISSSRALQKIDYKISD